MQAVKRDNKQRFSLLEEDGELLIRANQGHTVTVCSLSEISCTDIEDVSLMRHVFTVTVYFSLNVASDSYIELQERSGTCFCSCVAICSCHCSFQAYCTSLRWEFFSQQYTQSSSMMLNGRSSIFYQLIYNEIIIMLANMNFLD